MGRLIDADALIEAIRKHMIKVNSLYEDEKTVIDIINEQPTAYDVDKVVGQLKDKMNHSFNQRYKAFAESVVVVRKGGVEHG